MDIEIVEKKDNALLGRTEVKFRVLHAGAQTPKREEVREKLAAIVNAKKTLVVVDSMDSTFGHGETFGYAKVYPNPESAGKVEPEHLLKRNKLEEFAPKKRKASQPAPAAQKKAAAPRKK
jgi:small subunit ribosomal protein S24e